MITIYDLLEVKETASKDEIEKSYRNLILKYHKDPNLDEEANKENEIILNRLKIAYDILSNDEKRKQYDKDLAKKRAEELLQNISVKPSNTENDYIQEKNSSEEKKIQDKPSNINNSKNNTISNFNENSNNEDVTLNKEEKNKVIEAAKKEFKNNLKKAQIAEEEYKKAYKQEYDNYLRKMGYKVKQPWTLKRLRNIVITILVIIAVITIIWILPPSRNFLIKIYEDNFIIKAIVDIVITLIDAIFSIFKK